MSYMHRLADAVGDIMRLNYEVSGKMSSPLHLSVSDALYTRVRDELSREVVLVAVDNWFGGAITIQTDYGPVEIRREV